jgi:hypothetical protein
VVKTVTTYGGHALRLASGVLLVPLRQVCRDECVVGGRRALLLLAVWRLVSIKTGRKRRENSPVSAFFVLVLASLVAVLVLVTMRKQVSKTETKEKKRRRTCGSFSHWKTGDGGGERSRRVGTFLPNSGVLNERDTTKPHNASTSHVIVLLINKDQHTA